MCRCQQHGNDNAIRSYRTLTEVRLLDLLEQTKSTATLDDVKRFIFDESGRMRPSAYFAQLGALFQTQEKLTDNHVALVAGRRRLVAALYAFGKSGIIDVLPDS
jgi:hypothetical protein